MGNRYRGWVVHLILISIFLVANTYTCLGARNITMVACSKQERLALLKFKNSVKDDYHMLSSWDGNDCCMWKRVRCDGATGYVEALHLRGFWDVFFDDGVANDIWEGLSGNEVSTCLGVLRHLKYMDLSGNDFQGSRIPDFIGSLRQLTYLNLSYAGFSGIIPHHIRNLSNLKVLDLSSNQHHELMTDDMAWISGLSSLKHLDLSNVDLSGAKLSKMVLHMIPSLVKLSLSSCGLLNVDLGPLLNSSTTLANIKYLDLSLNHFSCQVPHIFQNMTSLQFLDLSYLNLSLAWNSENLLSLIPSVLELQLSGCGLHKKHLNLSLLSKIQHLDLSWNLFKGGFPSFLANMTSLRVLDLSHNSLHSLVPVMPNLLDLDLSSNKFNQLVDVGFWRQCHLKQLTLSSNNFFMESNDSPINVSEECSQYAMEWLYLDGNAIGTIPESLGRMASLRVINLVGSRLTGLIPESLGRLRLLQELDLSDNALTGPIPTFLGRSRLLEELDLSKNQLTGPIPTFQGKLTRLLLSNNHLNGSIPDSIGRLKSLASLILGANQLTGPIPTSLGRLVSLQSFSVSSNLLNGTIPVSIGQLSKLQSLDISNNSLEGVVSEAHFANLLMLKQLNTNFNSRLSFNVSREWMPPFQLIRIDLSSCNIVEGFPQWLRSQRKLMSLKLSNATMSGPLPTWLRKLPIILWLDLSHNKLSGSLTNLPNGGSIYVFGTTRGLLLQNNLFNESIPSSLCTMTNLGVLNLSRNKLTGKIPKCLGDLKSLRFMMLSSNRLSGVIPSCLGHIPFLMWLNLNNNSFSGELPRELGNLENLEILDLGDNELSGNIPEWIGEKIATLVVFRLHKNNFSGRIPLSLCRFSFLRILDVANNNLSGSIPHCLRELYGMVWLKETYFMFTSYDANVIQVMKGVALEYSKTMQFVINMDLSSNKLVGEIPVELTALGALVGLNLSNNHLSGSIPTNIGNMKGLISLDFSRNKLTGLIPQSITALNFLSHLNLSHNNLSGRIPTGNQLQTLIDPSIYAGNKELCGAPLPKNCSNYEDPTTACKRNHRKGNGSRKTWLYGLDIMSGFATGFWGFIGVLVFKKRWRHKFFMSAEATTDKIYVAVMVNVAKMKRGRRCIHPLN